MGLSKLLTLAKLFSYKLAVVFKIVLLILVFEYSRLHFPESFEFWFGLERPAHKEGKRGWGCFFFWSTGSDCYMTTNPPTSRKNRNKNLGLDAVLEIPRVQEATASLWHRKITVIIQPDVSKTNKTPCEHEGEQLVHGCFRIDVALLQVSLLRLRQDSHRF